MHAKPGLKAFLDGILTLPMVLPPTAAGFFLLLIFSTRRPFGAYLYDTFGIRVIQSWLGCVIAAMVIAFPLMYRNARAAFEQIDVNLIYAARTLGMSEWKIFWKVVIPTAGPGVAARHDSDFCAGHGRVWSHIHAGREYSGKNRDDCPENSYGHSGRRLYDCRSMGHYCPDHCFYHRAGNESVYRKKDEKCKTMVILRMRWRRVD